MTRLKSYLLMTYLILIGCSTTTDNHMVTQSGFRKVLALNGVSFTVVALNDSSLSTVTITPSGFKNDNTPITREVDGTVQDAEIADINSDGYPEVYVYAQSAGSGSYGSVIALSSNKNLSVSDIYIPPLDEKSKAAKGYMGHDEFAVVEGTLIQRFPVYRNGDSNAKPTGGMRQLQYKLKPGEAGRAMKVDRVVEY
jgi:Periplasmic lysozyme inhibitor of I-type lysozyme